MPRNLSTAKVAAALIRHRHRLDTSGLAKDIVIKRRGNGGVRFNVFVTNARSACLTNKGPDASLISVNTIKPSAIHGMPCNRVVRPVTIGIAVNGNRSTAHRLLRAIGKQSRHSVFTHIIFLVCDFTVNVLRHTQTRWRRKARSEVDFHNTPIRRSVTPKFTRRIARVYQRQNVCRLDIVDIKNIINRIRRGHFIRLAVAAQ